MSATHTDAHGHGGHGKDHVPHVLPLAIYLGVFAMLLIFTVITVAVSYVDLGHTVNLAIALGVATMKASMVGLIFMHLAFDNKFNAIVFTMSVIFLAIFIGLTMYDTEFRGLGGRVAAEKPADSAVPFAGTRSEAALRARFGEVPVAELD
jgi:cytochrome c oxidase subunit IV